MFGWRKEKRAARQSRRLPRRVLAPVEEIVEQGLLVADVALRMTVKNEIIMNALKKHADYREDEILALVRSAAEDLAEEREHDAEHIGHVREEIRDRGHSSWTEAEYGSDDNRTLRHRQEVYENIAQQLRARASDEAYLRATAERAREMAWHEIGDSLKERASHPYYSGGDSDEYREARDDRIQQLIEKDLTSLVKQKSKAEKGKKRED